MRGDKKCQSLFPDRSWSSLVKVAERIVGHGWRPANAASATYTGVAPIVIHDDISSERIRRNVSDRPYRHDRGSVTKGCRRDRLFFPRRPITCPTRRREQHTGSGRRLKAFTADFSNDRRVRSLDDSMDLYCPIGAERPPGGAG